MPSPRSPRARIVLTVLIVATILAGAGVAFSLRTLEPRLHTWITSTLARSLESEIELGKVDLTWVPLRLHAQNLTVRHHGRTDVPPLLVAQSFMVDLTPVDLWSSTIDRVWVDGLEFNIPPKDPDTGERPFPRSGASGDDAERTGDGFVVRRLSASNARLAMIPREAGKNPRVWDIYELEIENLKGGEPATFVAALINPIPYGKIESRGQFGPWNSNQPGASPLAGEYTFAADLGTINGLAGAVSATGEMSGVLNHIATTGQTETPDFRLTELDGRSLPLRTAYEAVVDGTKGDVELHNVAITLGKSRLSAKGLVEGTKGIKGKRVIVNVKSSTADLGELLTFVSKSSQPVANGILTIDAAMDLPQGQAPVLDRLALEGSVRAERVRFSSDAVQDKIDDLSRRGQGRPKDESIDDVASRMSTKFVLSKGVFTYRGLSFVVNGADIRLDGTHSLKSKQVDLSGVAMLKASVSQTQTGFKSWLLKPFDPLFRKNGAGSRLVITVAGTQDQPKVGLDVGKTIRGK